MTPTQRRNLWVALAGAAVLAVIVAAVVLLMDSDDDEDVVTGDGTTTTAAEATTTTQDETTTTNARGSGEVIVAVDGDSRVVSLDAESGEVQRVLVEGVPVDDPAKNDVAVTPSGDAAYVVRPGEGADEPTILQVPLDGGDPEVVATGLAPAVSPDGDRLAYVAFEGREAQPRIVVRDLADGSEREIAPGDEMPFVFISDLAWTHDSDRIAFIAGQTRTGAWFVEASAATLDAAQQLGPTAREEGSSWVAVASFEDRLAVSEFCCNLPATRHVLLSVLLDPVKVEGALLEEEFAISNLDSNEAGDSLLFVADVKPGEGTLYRWNGEGEARKLADNIVAAAW